MRFLVDAQLPARLCDFLEQHGHDAIHVSILPNGNRLTDAKVAEMADDEHRVVASKDADFRHSHTTIGAPQRLLVVATGSISNHVLLDLIGRRLDDLVAPFATSRFRRTAPRSVGGASEALRRGSRAGNSLRPVSRYPVGPTAGADNGIRPATSDPVAGRTVFPVLFSGRRRGWPRVPSRRPIGGRG